jgi:hypothetical protein
VRRAGQVELIPAENDDFLLAALSCRRRERIGVRSRAGGCEGESRRPLRAGPKASSQTLWLTRTAGCLVAVVEVVTAQDELGARALAGAVGERG